MSSGRLACRLAGKQGARSPPGDNDDGDVMSCANAGVVRLEVTGERLGGLGSAG